MRLTRRSMLLSTASVAVLAGIGVRAVVPAIRSGTFYFNDGHGKFVPFNELPLTFYTITDGERFETGIGRLVVEGEGTTQLVRRG